MNKLTPFIFTLFIVLNSFQAQAAKLNLQDFKTENHFRDIALSPNGRYLATLWNENNRRTVIVQDMEQGGKKISTFGDVAVRPNWMVWANNGRLLVNISIPINKSNVEKEAKKNPNFNFGKFLSIQRLVSFKPDGSENKQLMAREQRAQKVFAAPRMYHNLPKNKDVIQMTGKNKDRLTIYNVNVETGKAKIVEKGGKYTIRFLSDEEGKLLYRLDWLSVAKAIIIYDYIDGDWVKKERFDIYIDDNNRNVLANFSSVLPNGSIVFRKQNKKTGFYELLTRSSEGKISTFISYPDKDVTGVLRSYGSRLIGHTIEEDDVIRHVFLDEDRQKEYENIKKKILPLGVSYFTYASHHATSDISVLRSYGMDDPGAYYLHQKSTNDLIFYSFAHKTLIPANLGIPAIVNYKTRDQATIKAYIFLPNDYQEGKKYPMVMMPHGGPHVRDYAYYDSLAQFLATRGYVVMKPNFRGSTGYGKAFEEAGIKQWNGRIREDIEDGVKYLISTGIIDKDKVCIAGTSFGGYSALMGAINKENLYQCAISMNGVTNTAKQNKHFEKKNKDSPIAIKYVRERYGHFENDEVFLNSQSPTFRVNEIQLPILLIGGENDQTVPFSQQEEMKEALETAKKEFEFIKLGKTGHHPYNNKANKQKVFSAIDAFLTKHLH